MKRPAAIAISAMVASGLVPSSSPRIPELPKPARRSSVRSRRSASRRSFRSRRPSRTLISSPSRSRRGARFLSRVPQYGHSVTYGLTSEPQLRQMTLSSGPAILAFEDKAWSGDHETANDVLEVPRPLPGGELVAGPGALPEDLPDGFQVVGAAELHRVARKLLEQALGELGRRHVVACVEVDELALHAADRSPDLVVVEELGWVLDERLLRVVEERQPPRERNGERGQGERRLKARLLVADPRFDRPQLRVWADVPPQVRV